MHACSFVQTLYRISDWPNLLCRTLKVVDKKTYTLFSRQGRLRWYFRDLIRPMRVHALSSIREMCFDQFASLEMVIPRCLWDSTCSIVILYIWSWGCEGFLENNMDWNLTELKDISHVWSRLCGDRYWVRCKQYLGSQQRCIN